MRGTFKCGRIQGVIIYEMTKLNNLEEKVDSIRDLNIKVQVVDLKSFNELYAKENVSPNTKYGLVFENSKKSSKNLENWENLLLNQDEITTIFMDEAIIKSNILELSEYRGDIFVTLSTKTKARDYEMLFHTYSNMGICGINFDIDSVTKGQIALCTKFKLKSCAHSILFDRHIEKAKELELESIIL